MEKITQAWAIHKLRRQLEGKAGEEISHRALQNISQDHFIHLMCVDGLPGQLKCLDFPV